MLPPRSSAVSKPSLISKKSAPRSYQQVREEGKAEWEKQLSRIAVTDSPDRMSTFYSCLYRSLLFPRRFYEINGKGEVVHYSPYNGQILPGYLYTDTGYWDTFPSPLCR